MNTSFSMFIRENPYLAIERWSVLMRDLVQYHPCLGEDCFVYVHGHSLVRRKRG